MAGHAGRRPAFGRLLADAGEIVRQEVATLQRLVEEFSAFARLPDVAPSPADLGDFVEDFVRTSPQLARAGRSLEIVRPAGRVPVALDAGADAPRARQPVRERRAGGRPGPGPHPPRRGADPRPGRPHGGRRGAGRSSRQLRPRVFDPYFTTKGEGTGLGLAIVKKIVLQHGGEIEAGERPGGGACFTICLPLADDPG